MKHRVCNLVQKIYADVSAATKNKYFAEFRSINKKKHLLNPAGVCHNTFILRGLVLAYPPLIKNNQKFVIKNDCIVIFIYFKVFSTLL